MSEENKICLVCPPWEQRNPWCDTRKVTCSECKQDIAVSAHNIPQVVCDKITLLCVPCAKRRADTEGFVHKGTNLPGSGHYDPDDKRVPWDEETNVVQ